MAVRVATGFDRFMSSTRHDVLPHDRVVELARRMSAGVSAAKRLDADIEDPFTCRALRRDVQQGLAARQELVLHNLRLVTSIAKRYRVDGMTTEDLFQEGVIGLLTAIDRFDPERGYRLSTYATWWIRHAVERSIADKARMIRLPVHIHEQLKKLASMREGIVATKGWASFDDLIDATGFSPSRVRALMRLLPGHASLDAVVGDGLATLGELCTDPSDPGPDDLAILADECERTAAMVDSLPAREADIIRLRFGIGGESPHTLEAAGMELHVTRERIRQIEVKAMERLRLRCGVAHPPV